MALKQIVPIEITLVGDGSSTTFTFSLQNMYQNGTGNSVPVGAVGAIPSSISVPNPPVAVTSATIDANGNITITLTSALGNNVQATFEVDLFYTSGGVSSSSTTQSQNVGIVTAIPAGSNTIGNVNVQSSGTTLTNTGGSLNVNITGGSSGNGAASATGSAVPSQADYQGVKVGSNLVGVTGFTVGSSTAQAVAIVDGSGAQITSFGGGTQYAEGSTQATATGTVSLGKNGTTVKAIQTDSSGNLVVVQATAASLNATVVGTGTFAVQATQSGTWTVTQGGSWSVNSVNSQQGAVTTAWTSATTINTVASAATVGYNSVTLTLAQGSTITGGQVTFEASDSASVWYQISGVQLGISIANVSVYTLTQSVNTAFQFDVSGFTAFRVRLSTVISGTGTVNVNLVTNSGARAMTQSLATGTVPVNGTVAATIKGNLGNTLDASISAATAPTNMLAVGGVYNSSLATLTNGQSQAFQLSQLGGLRVQGVGTSSNFTATTVSTSSSIGVSDFNVCTLVLNTFTGTGPSVTFGLQASTDGTNWITLQGINNTTGQVGTSWTQASALTAGTAGYSIDYTIGAVNFVRINVTAISGSSPSAGFTAGLQTMPYEASPGAICQGLAAAGSAVVGNPVLIGGSVTTAAPSYSTSTVNNLSLTTAGGLRSDNSSWGGTALGTPTNFGTTPGAVVSGSVNSSVFIGTVAAVAAASGVQKVGISGNAGGSLDTAINTGASPGNMLVVTHAPATASVFALSAKTVSANTTLNIKASAGNLYGFAIVNTSTSAGFIQFFNTSTTTTTAPLLVLPIPGSATNGGYIYVQPGAFALLNFTTGIAFGCATTVGGATTLSCNGTVFFE